MINFIENIGDYFSQHFFNEDFPKKVFDRSGFVTQKKDDDGNKIDNHISTFNQNVGSLRVKYDRFKNQYLAIKRTKERIKLAHDFNTELLNVLGYVNGRESYDEPVYMEDTKVIPVRYRFTKGGKPFLFIMEMKPMIQEGDIDPDGLYEQSYQLDDWEKVLPNSWKNYEIKPEVIKEALSELFLLSEDERPQYLIMLAGPKIFLMHYEKWKYDSYLLFDLEELFSLSQIPSNRNYLALFYALLAKQQFISDTESVLTTLEEDAHKASYGVTKTLKNAVIYAVESLANEAIYYKKDNAKTLEDKHHLHEQLDNETFARELKDECLSFVYRLLFLFYAESREDLEILPVKDSTYQKGYSLEMLRDLEMVNLRTDSSRNGHFFSESLWKLFDFIHTGSSLEDGFLLKPLDSPLFDNHLLKHLSGVQFRNSVLKEIILRLSLSERTRNKARGRISYSNLGINQLGSVYESLLAYSGFFAKETLIEVKAADDDNGKEGTFLVPQIRRDDFEEEEILKDPEQPELDVEIPKGHFVYRLNGRDRKKSASYYTPEVLTQSTVKYTLKGILDKLREKQNIVDGELKGEACADEILSLKILEPAMGAAAFHNEVINQLAVAYLELKEYEEVAKGNKRITPGNYKDEVQKVKAYIAANNVYGVDINPTAIELGKISLWLNCMHKNMETPFFAHRLGTGNAVVGAWLKVYKKKDIIQEFPTEGTKAQRSKPIAKAWWLSSPKRLKWLNDGNLNRKENEIYHFLLPDDNMVPSFKIKLLKDELSDAEKTRFNRWKTEIKKPYTGEEFKRLQRISTVIDYLLEEHYKQIKGVIKDTTSVYHVYGQDATQKVLRGYDEKERLAETRNNRTAPYYKLKMVMDYWCSLWFWDVRDVADLPTREQWYNEIESLLQVDASKLSTDAKPADIKEAIYKQTKDLKLFDSGERRKKVEQLAEKHRFFHNELEFIEVFKERGGFDVIVGNPPWVKITFEEAELMSEIYPEITIRKEKAPVVAKRRPNYLAFLNRKLLYLDENISSDSSANFMNAIQNYHLLRGQQTDLYRSVIVETLDSVNKDGFIGLIHPESIYDDPKGMSLRKVVYKKLRYHFQFKNELKLFDIDHHNVYSLNIYSGSEKSVNFFSIHNLFHPSTITLSFSHSGKGIPGGIKKLDEKGKFIWNIDPHKNRIINFNESTLRLLAKTFEDSDKWETTKLVSIHSDEILSVLEKLSEFKGRISNRRIKISECWHETNDVGKYIVRNTCFPDYENYELILNGPHFFVSNPFYKTPREVCEKNQDFDNILLPEIDENFVPRTNYTVATETDKFVNGINGLGGVKKWIDYYKVGISKMISLTGERSLQAAIIPPKVSHVNGVISVIFENLIDLVEFTGLSSSIVLDFFVKSIGAANLTDGKLKFFPIGVSDEYKKKILLRTLLLNCLTKPYSELWEKMFDTDFFNDSWSKIDLRLKSIEDITEKWNVNIPLRNFYERRWALIELDVLSAMALGLNLKELILVYKVQFPVLQNYEENTYYDSMGNIAYTNNSQGLKGIGVTTKEWNEINSFKSGEVYEYTLERNDCSVKKRLS